MRTPVTRKTLSDHWTYNWWKYLLVLIAATIGWNLIFTMTEYRSPADKTITIYTNRVDDSTKPLAALLEDIVSRVAPDNETTSIASITNDSTYRSMQISTYIGTGMGGFYLLDGDDFQQYAAGGAFVPLEDEEEITAALEETGLDADKGRRTDSDTYERHLFGIPVSSLTGLKDCGVNTDNAYIAVVAGQANQENLIKVLAQLIRETAQR